ncbi:MAG: hypothetical protein ACXIVG_01050 [Pararhodobacter sp.]
MKPTLRHWGPAVLVLAALAACAPPGMQPGSGPACAFDVQGRVDPTDCSFTDTPDPVMPAPPPVVVPPPPPPPAPANDNDNDNDGINVV